MISISKPVLGKEEEMAVLRVLRSGMLAGGKGVEEFESAFAKFVGCRYGVATTSGTMALILTLLSHGIKKGDEVITTPFSFIATANSCLYVGSKPVFVDIEPDGFNIDPTKIERRITSRTKAIMVVHLFGKPCQMDKILKICQKNKLILIEDACQAHGAKFKGKQVGSFGTGCFSFYATKNMTTGEGGMITTNSLVLADKIRLLRNHGQEDQYYSSVLGYNFRLTDIQAAIGIEQLKKLNKLNQIRRENADYLNKQLRVIPGIVLPQVGTDSSHVFHQFTIRLTNEFPVSRNQFLEILRKSGIDARIYYPLPIYRQELYRKLGYKDSLPVVEKVVGEILSLPIHPQVTKSDLDKITRVVKRLAMRKG